MKNVPFTFEGIEYVIKGLVFGRKGVNYWRILLPDARIVFVEKWTKTGLRKPVEVTFSNIVVDDIGHDKKYLEFHNDCIVADYKNLTPSMAKQAIHDYYANLAREGKLDPHDQKQYELAMEWEKNGEVDPLPETKITTLSDASAQLKNLIEEIEEIVKIGNQIFEKAGGRTMGQIAKIGEIDHLDKIKNEGGGYWIKALPLAAQICKEKGIVNPDPIKVIYAQNGIFNRNANGAIWVAESIINGRDACLDGYYPIGHLSGMAAALRYVLDR